MAVNKVVYKHFEVKVSPAAAHAVDALLFGCGKINNDLNPDYNADLVNSVAFRASECKITRVVRKNADDESTVLYDGTPANYFYLEYEPEDENDNGLFSITVKKTDGTDALKVVTVPYGTNRRPVYATQDEALRARMTQAEDDIDGLETRMTTVEGDIDDLETRMKTAEDDIDGLETRMTTVEGDIDDLETRMKTAEGDIDSLETRMTTVEGDIDDLETRVDTIEETTIPGINSRVEALQAGEETLNKTIELLSGSVETVGENYNTLSDSVGLLTTQVESNATQIESLQTKADRALISSLQLVGKSISNVDNFFVIPFNALSVEFTIRFPAGSTINGSIIGVLYYATGSAIETQLIATQNMMGRDAPRQPDSLLLKLDLANQSAILCKNVAVSNNSELQEASDVYGNTYFKNAGISGNGMIRGVKFNFVGLGTPTVSALAVTATVGTRYDDSGGSP